MSGYVPDKLHNDHPLTSDKIEIKRKMFSNYQLKITDYHKIKNNKKLMPDFFDKESMYFIMKTCIYLFIYLFILYS